MLPVKNIDTLDVLIEILVRLPAKELCCLRVVRWSWRSLTTDRLFHQGARGSPPRAALLGQLEDDDAHVHIVDLAGNVLKRIAIPVGHKVVSTNCDLVCVATEKNSCCVLNLATGAVYDLPESPADEHMHHVHIREPYTSFAFGYATSTGEYKVLQMFDRPGFTDIELHQLCEVFTSKGGRGQARWRGKQSRKCLVEMRKANRSVVINGVVYFLMDTIYDAIIMGVLGAGIHPDFIFSFDLETEELREAIQGPISSSFVFDSDLALKEYMSLLHQLRLAELKGYLVLVYHQRIRSTMDLWFLTDYETRTWVKEYSIQTESFIPILEYDVKPLLVLDDGRIFISLGSTRLLLIYDPRTSIFAEVKMRHLADVGLYTGSLLSLENGDVA